LPYTRDYLSTRIGRPSQIGGIAHFTHADGKAKGTSTLRVRTAQGLEFWIVPDRGMDIFEAGFQGKSLCWHAPGAPSEDNGENLGLHGSISNTPAESVNWSEHWKGEEYLLTVSGKVREASVFGSNLLLERTISTSLESASFSLRDVVENQGVHHSPLMVLYHFNFGFPLLTERSRIYAPSQALEPATDFAAGTQESWDRFESPQVEVEERVYFHRMRPGPAGKVTVVLVSDSDRPEFGVALTYDPQTLPEFVQWKMTGANHFVLGLEPANCRTLGRKAERQRGTLQTLAPEERRAFQLEFRVLNGAEEVAHAISLA
jgi:hypothetical protein